MSLDDKVIVSVVDFVNTFRIKRKINDYGLTYLDYTGELPALLGRNEPYPKIRPNFKDLDQKTRYNYRTRKTIPKSVKAIKKLADYNIKFPIDCTNNSIITINNLTMFTGSIDRNFNIRLHINKKIKKHIDKKIYPFQLIHIVGDNYNISIGNDIGRIVSCFDQDFFYDLLLKKQEFSKEEQSLADNILYSFIEDLFLTKSTHQRYGTKYLQLNTKYKNNIEESLKIKEILEFCFNCNLQYKEDKRKENKANSKEDEFLYNITITFKRPLTDYLIENYSDKINFKVILQ